MAVYVDDMHLSDMGRLGRMRMCHMIATTDDELHAMAEAIGLRRAWWQQPPAHESHYDIATCKRLLALERGAIECTMREVVYMCRVRKQSGVLGSLEEARAYFAARAMSLQSQHDTVRQVELFPGFKA